MTSANISKRCTIRRPPIRVESNHRPIIPEVKAWQDRPLEPVNCIVWLDAMHYKVRSESKVEHKALYNIPGINSSGMKEVLGMYLLESEGANFWLQVLSDLHNRGLRDILIACTDISRAFQRSFRVSKS